tara:strand:- start:259 stop:594 length:336 start_codon:yes stop_codon:yes gene_type:complete
MSRGLCTRLRHLLALSLLALVLVCTRQVEAADAVPKAQRKPGERSICMWFIVKNEAKVLARLAKSAAGTIDYFYACDTGSTDGTPDIIRKEFGKHGIPGVVVDHKWENFGA